MKIWVDADACPVVVKEILYRAARRTGVCVTVVANRPLRTPPFQSIQHIQVAPGPDSADREIVKRLNAGDLVITADIPLAAAVIEKGGYALNPRGEMYSEDDIKSRLSIRDFMDALRDSGVDTGGPPALTPGDRQIFANKLDTFLTRHMKST